jgi:hypothetical protein
VLGCVVGSALLLPLIMRTFRGHASA